MGHSFDMLTFDFLLKPPQPFTGAIFNESFTRFIILPKLLVIVPVPFRTQSS